jgi:hypothetical protein
LNQQAQHVKALLAAKSAGEEVHRHSSPQPAGRQERRPWIERKDWFDRPVGFLIRGAMHPVRECHQPVPDMWRAG